MTVKEQLKLLKRQERRKCQSIFNQNCVLIMQLRKITELANNEQFYSAKSEKTHEKRQTIAVLLLI